MGDLIVRDMVKGDLPRVTALGVELGYPATEADTRARFKSIGDGAARGETGLVVVVSADSVIGFMQLTRVRPIESEPFVEIAALIVGEKARRTGAGRALVEHAKQWARARGFPKLRVRSNVTRAESHAFYPALGFALGKTQHVYDLSLVER